MAATVSLHHERSDSSRSWPCRSPADWKRQIMVYQIDQIRPRSRCFTDNTAMLGPSRSDDVAYNERVLCRADARFERNVQRADGPPTGGPQRGRSTNQHFKSTVCGLRRPRIACVYLPWPNSISAHVWFGQPEVCCRIRGINWLIYLQSFLNMFARRREGFRAFPHRLRNFSWSDTFWCSRGIETRTPCGERSRRPRARHDDDDDLTNSLERPRQVCAMRPVD
jgi:hypothetical protein